MNLFKYVAKTQKPFLISFMLLGTMLIYTACQSETIITSIVQATPTIEVTLPPSSPTSTPRPTVTATASPTPRPTLAVQGRLAMSIAGNGFLLVDTNGENVTTLVTDTIVTTFAWSSDGQKLAFSGVKQPETTLVNIHNKGKMS